MRYFPIAAALLLMLNLGACNNDTPDRCEQNKNEQIGINQLPDRRTQWQGNDLSNYILSYRNLYFFSNRLVIEITIVNKEITSIVEKDNFGEIVNNIPENEFSNYFTIDGFFEFIQSVKNSVDKIVVEYDSSLGYPTLIDIDPQGMRCNCNGVCTVGPVDDEYTYTISVDITG